MAPLEVLFDPECGKDIPLPEDLSALYGRLQFPLRGERPRVIANFVTTLDGVVALGAPGKTDGDEISGSDEHDSAVMGLLRAASDGIIIGAGTLRKSPRHIWTPEFVSPGLSGSYSLLRSRLGKQQPPCTVVVSASGDLDPELPIFRSGETPVAIVTTHGGCARLERGGMDKRVRIIAAARRETLSVGEILTAVRSVAPDDGVFLVEGGPHLLGQFLDRGMIDELFVTLSPRLAGRDEHAGRQGLVSGVIFLPDRIVRGTLEGVRRGGNHLFLRYGFNPEH